MFKNLETKLKNKTLLLNKLEELHLEYQERVSSIVERIDAMEVDEVFERKYNVALYAIDNFAKCKDMSVEEAIQYVEELFKREEENGRS